MLRAGAARFGGEFFLRIGVERQQIQRPEQGCRGGLMAGQDHGCDLVGELRVVERLAGFRIARGDHQVEQIARRAFACTERPPLGDQHAQELRPLASKGPAREIARARPVQRQQHVQDARLGEALRIVVDEIAQSGAVAVEREREHGASGDIQRQALHGVAQVGRAAALAIRDPQIASSVAASMCGVSNDTARGENAGASVRR